MNVAIISGHLVENAKVRGKQTKALAFVVATKQTTHNGEGDKEVVNYVPCVMFNPAQEVEQRLTTSGAGVFCEFQGRLNLSKFDQEDRPRYSAEVVVFNKSFQVLS